MLTRALRAAAIPALALAALSACSDGPTGNEVAFDLDAVQAQEVLLREALTAPVLHSLFGSMDMGVGFALVPSPALSPARSEGTGMRAALRSALPSMSVAGAVGEGSYVPAEQWGRTYVRDAVNGGLVWDASRTDAPARGVRIVLYQRIGLDGFTNTPVGALDVIDSSTTAMTMGRLNLYDAGGQQVGTFRETMSAMLETATTMSATFSGTVGIAPKTFTVADTMSGSVTQTASGRRTNLRWRSIGKANFTDAQRSLTVTGMDLDSETSSGTAEMEIRLGGHVTKIVGEGSPVGLAGTARIYVDGTHVASADAQSEQLRNPSGGPLSLKVQTYLMHVVMTAMRIPDSLMVRFVVLMHIPFYMGDELPGY